MVFFCDISCLHYIISSNNTVIYSNTLGDPLKEKVLKVIRNNNHFIEHTLELGISGNSIPGYPIFFPGGFLGPPPKKKPPEILFIFNR